MTYQTNTALSVALWASALAWASAHAETSASATPDASNELGEIVVTAQKREQKLSDVGITIVAVNGAQLQASGITDVLALPKIAPGLSVGTSFAGYPIFSLRGVNFNAVQISAPPAVSTYIDQAVLPYPSMTEGLLLDAERVEVLKGPQGTLFGQNATGGSINVIANKPTSTFAAGVGTEVNNFGQTMLEGYVSGPLSDTLRARLAATTTHFGAWQEGYYLYHGKNGDQNKGAARLLLDWTPTDKLKVSANINGNYDHGEAQQAQLFAVTPRNPATAHPGLIGYPLPSNDRDVEMPPGFDTHEHDRLYQTVLRVDYELTDSVTVTSLTNYANFNSRSLRNLSAVALPVIYDAPEGNDRTLTQELRLSGTAYDSKLTYIVGGNYEKDKLYDYLAELFPGYSTLPPGAVLDNRFDSTARSASVFGNIDYEFIPRLTFTSGVRYTSAKETTQGCTYGNAPSAALLGFIANVLRGEAGLPPSTEYVPNGCLTINNNVPVAPGGMPDYQPIATNAAQTESNVSWREGLNFKPTPDSLVYALVSRGFKAGVYPAQSNILNSTEEPVRQEELTSYEIGTKQEFLDKAVHVNVSAFYYDYRNKQFFTYTPLPLVGYGSVVRNVPKSSVKGVDMDFIVTPSADLTLRGAVTYIKTQVGQYETYNLNGQLTDVTGSQFNFAPPWSATFDAEYRFPVIGNVTPYVGIDGLYNARTYGDLGEPPTEVIPAYFIADARLGVRSSKGWRVGLFVRNLADKYYWTSVIPTGDTSSQYAGLPRMYGINAGYTF